MVINRLKRKFYDVCIGICLLISFSAAANDNRATKDSSATNDSFIVDFLKKNQPQGRGPGVVIDKKVGVLHGKVNTTVVLYGYQVGPDMDRNHWHYLVVFEDDYKNGRVLHTPSRWIQVGGSSQHFKTISIENKTIVLSGVKRLPGDAMCCPSAKVKVSYKLVNRELVAQGEWEVIGKDH